MRIIGGEYSGRKLVAPDGWTTRPMTDRVRGALFNILTHRNWGGVEGDNLEGVRVMDAFCGTGALAFEAISRGASRATLFDKDPNALKAARNNAASLGISGKCEIRSADTLRPPRATLPCQLVFIAPPYRKGLVYPAFQALLANGWIAADSVVVIETAKREILELPNGFSAQVERSYGDTTLYFVTGSRLDKPDFQPGPRGFGDF